MCRKSNSYFLSLFSHLHHSSATCKILTTNERVCAKFHSTSQRVPALPSVTLDSLRKECDSNARRSLSTVSPRVLARHSLREREFLSPSKFTDRHSTQLSISIEVERISSKDYGQFIVSVYYRVAYLVSFPGIISE